MDGPGTGQKPARRQERALRREGARFSVRVSYEEREYLQKIADENNLTITGLLRLAMTTFVEDVREGEVQIIRRTPPSPQKRKKGTGE